MDILVVDPNRVIAPAAEDVFRGRGWRTIVTADRGEAFRRALYDLPDAVVVHGDGRSGETTHLCQRFKQNPLTAGIPLVLVEDAPPPAWLLAGMPADAFTQPPFEPSELLHHLDVLVPDGGETSALDDLTNCPRRRSVLAEIQRRLLSRDLFAAGLLTLREPDAYRQDFGRTGIDQFVVLVSVILRRHAANGTPVSIGYLDEGAFMILGAPAVVHHLLGQTIRHFEALVPAFYEMDTLFAGQEAHTGPFTWVSLEGAVCLVEPGRFDNALQVGFALAENLTGGQDALRQATHKATASEPSRMVAD
jgi:CheY-like chemotaxis protein